MARPKTDINLIAVKRIRQFIKSKGMTQNEFAKTTNYSQPTISKMVCGKTAVTAELIEKIIDIYPDLNPLWFTGESNYELADDQSLYDEYIEAQNSEDEKTEIWEGILTQSGFVRRNIYAFELFLRNMGYRTEYRDLTKAEAEIQHCPFVFDIVDEKTKKVIASFPLWDAEYIANGIADYAEFLIKKRIEEKRLETANNSDGVENHEV